MKSVYCAVRTGSLNKAVCASSLNVSGAQIILFSITMVHNIFLTAGHSDKSDSGRSCKTQCQYTEISKCIYFISVCICEKEGKESDY
jgi:hypothetical protein